MHRIYKIFRTFRDTWSNIYTFFIIAPINTRAARITVVQRGDILLVVLVSFGTLLKNSSAFDVVLSRTLPLNRLYCRRFRYTNHVKFPVVKWLKHDHVVICVAEVSEITVWQWRMHYKLKCLIKRLLLELRVD